MDSEKVANNETNNSDKASEIKIPEGYNKMLGGITGKGFMPGKSGNPSGRPKGTMKEYLRRKFQEMSDEEKEDFLKKYRVSGKDQIELAEGRPRQETEHSFDDESNLHVIIRKFTE